MKGGIINILSVPTYFGLDLAHYLHGYGDMKRLIVGIDPGVTCGVAALTLDGASVFVGSKRGWNLNDLLKMLAGLGEPIVVSTDVSPAPDLVRKLSRRLNATIFTPLISLGMTEKQHLAKDYAEDCQIKLENAHEVDALAAALKAYKHFKRKFDQIEMRVKELGFRVSIDDVKALVIKGYTINRAIIYLTTKPQEAGLPSIPTMRVPREERLKGLVDELKERLVLNRQEASRLQIENRELRKQARSLKREVFSLQQKIDEITSEQLVQIRREKEYQRLQDEMEALEGRFAEASAKLEEYKQRFDALQRLRELESKREVALVKPIESFTRDGLERAFRLYEVKPGDYVFLLDAGGGGPTTANTMVRRGVKAVICQTPMSHQAQEEFAKFGVPVIPAGDVKIEWIEGFPYVNVTSLRDALSKLKETEIGELLNSLENIIDEHRKESRRTCTDDNASIT